MERHSIEEHHRYYPDHRRGLWIPFEENKEYLVYVVIEPKDIQTGICTGTKNIAEAEQEMKQLDKILESRPR